MKPKIKKHEEKAFTPGFDFSEKITTPDGKERKIEMVKSGLYVFGKDEKFVSPAVEVIEPRGLWVRVDRPVMKVRGKTIRDILNLTKKHETK